MQAFGLVAAAVFIEAEPFGPVQQICEFSSTKACLFGIHTDGFEIFSQTFEHPIKAFQIIIQINSGSDDFVLVKSVRALGADADTPFFAARAPS